MSVIDFNCIAIASLSLDPEDLICLVSPRSISISRIPIDPFNSPMISIPMDKTVREIITKEKKL
jgi:hypothetical protein